MPAGLPDAPKPRVWPSGDATWLRNAARLYGCKGARNRCDRKRDETKSTHTAAVIRILLRRRTIRRLRFIDRSRWVPKEPSAGGTRSHGGSFEILYQVEEDVDVNWFGNEGEVAHAKCAFTVIFARVT
jgi:hypothetical protein